MEVWGFDLEICGFGSWVMGSPVGIPDIVTGRGFGSYILHEESRTPEFQVHSITVGGTILFHVTAHRYI